MEEVKEKETEIQLRMLQALDRLTDQLSLFSSIFGAEIKKTDVHRDRIAEIEQIKKEMKAKH